MKDDEMNSLHGALAKLSSEDHPATVKIQSLKSQSLKSKNDQSPGVGDMLTEDKSEMPSEGFGGDGASVVKQFTSRNGEHGTQLKPPITEDPEEESKSDRNLDHQTRPGDINQYATIADNLPASATEVDPNPAVKEEE